MKLGVVICPHCKHIKGIDLSYNTTKCPRCGKILKVKNLRIFYKTNSQEKLCQVIGLMNAELIKRKGNFKKIM